MHSRPLQYVGRPGISPALAALIALGRVRRGNRILDIGCGTGTDALLLAKWGFRRVDGIDSDPEAIATARGRATRAGLSGRVRFRPLAAERLTEAFPGNTFDLALHTLVANNLVKDKERHFREVAAVMKPRGLLVLHERVGAAQQNARPGRVGPMTALRRHFDLTTGVATQLAEHPSGRKGPAYGRVVLWLGSPRT